MKQDGFFKQSCADALQDYIYSCKEGKGENWDWIVVTAANKKQADAFRIQIEKRKNEQWLPIGTKITVISDYKDERIGSGGATLNVIREIAEKESIERLLGEKILIIHSGGDSKRIPQYSACGKLFAPVPRMLPNGNASTLFDELLILASGIPERIGKGIIIFPSDTKMLFNPLQLDLLSCDAAGLSIKASVSEGKEHGVFLQNGLSADHRNNNVARFLHKLPESLLREAGAVDDKDQVDIDTGCIWLGHKVVRSLSELIFTDGLLDWQKFEQYVNPKVCLNFYGDFVYPLADESTLDEFMKETSENGISEELFHCRKGIWDKLNTYHLSLVKMIPAKYIHFGMTHELYGLFVNDIDSYAYLGWKRCVNSNADKGTAIHSYVSEDMEMQGRAFIENSIIHENVRIGDGAILSNVEVRNCAIPGGVVLSGLKLENGKYVCRIYGRDDNPKSAWNAPFLNASIETLLDAAKLPKSEIWEGQPASIWNARIFAEKESMEEAANAALSVHRIISGCASLDEIEGWKNSVRHSLSTSFHEADVPFLLNWQEKIKRKVRLGLFYESVLLGEETAPQIEALCVDSDIAEIEGFIEEIAKEARMRVFPYNMRLFLAASDICRKYMGIEPKRANILEDAAYKEVKNCISKEVFSRYNMDFRTVKIKKNQVKVNLPVRVNFCGSPSDAAPYCLEHGGTMIDGTLLLRGEKPISVTVEKIKEGIEFGSADQDSFVRYMDIKKVQDCGDPFDPFALHKAVLVSTGFIPQTGNLEMGEFCKTVGGGIRITTAVKVPKGSGLGTSSIIAAAAIKAIHLLFGNNPSDEMIYAQVFLAEQLMNTGGGWQDQVGGLTGGVKYFTSDSGEYQKLEVDVLDLQASTMDELNSRFVLIFSGQRRLARNVLREEMNQCIRNDAEAMEAIKEIQEYCAVMRHYLLKGNITEFAKYITKQFELVKKLDKGASNTCIEYIFHVIDDLIDGKSICGAGGGGFLQVILKKGITKDQLKERIAEEFADCGVEVWDCELI